MKHLLVVAAVALTAAAGNLGGARAAEYRGVDLFTLQDADYPYTPRGASSFVAGGQVVGSTCCGSSNFPSGLALLWSTPTGVLNDLAPTNLGPITNSAIYGTDGVRQVGEAGRVAAFGYGIQQHAALWSGTADSVVDLHPTLLPEFTASVAYGLSGNQQVGAGSGNVGIHAMLWTETAESAVDLHPTHLPHIGSSIAYATDGSQQVGAGYPEFYFASLAATSIQTGGLFPSDPGRALLWSNNAASAVDLHPDAIGDIVNSVAYGAAAGQQVGGGSKNGELVALLWHGTAESVIEMHPTDIAGIIGSMLYGTNGQFQVGNVEMGPARDRATLWSGSPDSAVDLHAKLPSGFVSSTAYSIDVAGNVYGLGTDIAGNLHALMWTAVPEPGTLAVASISLGLAVARAIAQRLLRPYCR